MIRRENVVIHCVMTVWHRLAEDTVYFKCTSEHKHLSGIRIGCVYCGYD